MEYQLFRRFRQLATLTRQWWIFTKTTLFLFQIFTLFSPGYPATQYGKDDAAYDAERDVERRESQHGRRRPEVVEGTAGHEERVVQETYDDQSDTACQAHDDAAQDVSERSPCVEETHAEGDKSYDTPYHPGLEVCTHDGGQTYNRGHYYYDCE